MPRASGHARLRRSPYPLRRSGHVGPAAGAVIPPRGDQRGHGQLRCGLRPRRSWTATTGSWPPWKGWRTSPAPRCTKVCSGTGSRSPSTWTPSSDSPGPSTWAPTCPTQPCGPIVMGERGADLNEHPDPAQLETMADLLRQGLDAGALGVTTSRTDRHRTSGGENLGTLRAREPELMALASTLRSSGRGVFQFLSDCYRTTDDDFANAEFALVDRVRRSLPAAGRATPCNRTSTLRNGGGT